MTPTQRQITRALRNGPLTYYDLMSKVDATEATINKAVFILLELGEVVEMKLGSVVGLKLHGQFTREIDTAIKERSEA